MNLRIVKANIDHLDQIAPLFDAYRVFYKQPSNLVEAKQFIQKRFLENDNVIFLAYDSEAPIGFTQLYKTFSSVSMQPFYILNDLFVHPSYRGQSVGKQLLEAAKKFCIEAGFKGLALETAKDNPAQKLYEKLGWKKDVEFLHYFWEVPK